MFLEVKEEKLAFAPPLSLPPPCPLPELLDLSNKLQF